MEVSPRVALRRATNGSERMASPTQEGATRRTRSVGVNEPGAA
jgi:hypothetical protein